jgi:carbonic anhydrase/acetyltransferase-like protein (isoleucine patch superfamily)
VHCDPGSPTTIGADVSVGHGAVVHGCTIEDEVLVGMGAIILDGARIGARSIIGANATVTADTVIPAGSLVLGSPAKVKRLLSPEEQAGVRVWAERYVTLSRAYLHRGT